MVNQQYTIVMTTTPTTPTIFRTPADTTKNENTEVNELTDTPIEINAAESLDATDTATNSDDDTCSDLESDDVVEPTQQYVSDFVFDRDYYFSHIYNGIIFKESEYYPMIEFKIIVINKDASKPILFKGVEYKCGWFIVDGENFKLEGPVCLNKEDIKNNLRVIDDKNFPNINDSEIESVSNESDSIIPREQIPHWMIKHLINKIDNCM